MTCIGILGNPWGRKIIELLEENERMDRLALMEKLGINYVSLGDYASKLIKMGVLVKHKGNPPTLSLNRERLATLTEIIQSL